MPALRLACRCAASISSSASSFYHPHRRWSLAALLRQPTHVNTLLKSVRQEAASSTDWDVDFSAIVERGAAAGCFSAESQSQLMGRVGAALAHVLLSSSQPQQQQISSSCVPAACLKTLRLTLPTPEAVLTLTQLAQTTSLLSTVTSLELTVDSGAIGIPQYNMGGTGGREVAELLHTFAEHSTRQTSWVDFSLLFREATPSSSVSVNCSASRGVQDPYASLLSHYAGRRSLWDDTTVAALAELINTKSWRKISLTHVPLAGCSPRTRQTLWAAYEKSCASLAELHLNGVTPVREFISMGLLSRFSNLKSVDVGQTQLEEDAVVKLLEDLHEGVRGWWRLRHLGLSQCELSDAAVAVMAVQLRERQIPQQQQSAVVQDRKEAHQSTENTQEGDEDIALTSLDIAGARFSRTSVFALAGCLVPCAELTSLNTRHCRLQADGVEHIAAALYHATGLRSWVLCLNRFGDEGVAALAKYGKHWPNLRELDVTRCRLTCAGVRALATVVPAWDGLEVLRLVGNDLRCLPRTSSLSAGGETNDNGYSCSTGLFAYDPTFMKKYGSSAKVPTSFELDRRDREEGRRRYRGTEEFAEAAAQRQAHATLTPLEHLGESLALCQRLRLLDVSDCALTDEGFRQLTQHFMGGGTLEELRLSANPLFTSVDGLDTLMAFLDRTPQVASLDLSFTGLGDLGLSMLCDGTSGAEDTTLMPMANLKTLQLASCAVHALGWESLTAALPRWPALQHISLNNNAVSAVELLRGFLQQLAATAPQLQSVDLMGCVADKRVVQQLMEITECRVLRKRGVQLRL